VKARCAGPNWPTEKSNLDKLDAATFLRTTTMNKRVQVCGAPEFMGAKGSGVDGFLLF
jgi:hypothetical protein